MPEPVDEYVGRPAAPVLRRWIGGYTGYRQRDVPPMRHRGLPSPWITVIFTLDDPLEVAQHPDPQQSGGSFDALVGGLHTRPALIVHDGRQSGVQIALHPLGSRPLLGVPAGELASLDVHADALIEVEGLRERLVGRDWAGRFDLLDEFFTARLDRPTGSPPGIAEACRRLGRGEGVAAVADEVGWSARHLSTLLRRETGLGPREFRRVARFDRARRLLQRDPALRVSDVAADVGCFDASHLVRDFHDFTGVSPGRWLAEEFRNVQDESLLTGTGSGT